MYVDIADEITVTEYVHFQLRNAGRESDIDGLAPGNTHLDHGRDYIGKGFDLWVTDEGVIYEFRSDTWNIFYLPEEVKQPRHRYNAA